MKALLIFGGVLAALWYAQQPRAAAAAASTADVLFPGLGGGLHDIEHPKRPVQCLGGGVTDTLTYSPSISSAGKLTFNLVTVHDQIPRTCARQEI